MLTADHARHLQRLEFLDFANIAIVVTKSTYDSRSTDKERLRPKLQHFVPKSGCLESTTHYDANTVPNVPRKHTVRKCVCHAMIQSAWMFSVQGNSVKDRCQAASELLIIGMSRSA